MQSPIILLVARLWSPKQYTLSNNDRFKHNRFTKFGSSKSPSAIISNSCSAILSSFLLQSCSAVIKFPSSSSRESPTSSLPLEVLVQLLSQVTSKAWRLLLSWSSTTETSIIFWNRDRHNPLCKNIYKKSKIIYLHNFTSRSSFLLSFGINWP